MTTIPQLRKDIHALQIENARLKEQLEAEKAKPPVIKEVTKEVRVPVTKVVEKEVPGPERVVYRDLPGKVVYRDNPKHIAMIRKLQGRQ